MNSQAQEHIILTTPSSTPILIPASKNTYNYHEYSLKQSLFDPSKNSPPNEFMLKLHQRMYTYNSFINDTNRIIE